MIAIEIKGGVAVPVPNEDRDPVLDNKDKPIMAAKYTDLHAFRHFFASWCINRRAVVALELPPKVVQERLGHSTIGMVTDVCGHLFHGATTAPGWPRRRRPCSLRDERDMGMIFPTIAMDGHR